MKFMIIVVVFATAGWVLAASGITIFTWQF